MRHNLNYCYIHSLFWINSTDIVKFWCPFQRNLRCFLKLPIHKSKRSKKYKRNPCINFTVLIVKYIEKIKTKQPRQTDCFHVKIIQGNKKLIFLYMFFKILLRQFHLTLFTLSLINWYFSQFLKKEREITLRLTNLESQAFCEIFLKFGLR